MRRSFLRSVLDVTARLLAAGILFQTLFFKFTGAEESRYIFSTLHMEPWGRIGAGLAELLCCLLLLLPGTVVLGALLTLGVIGGALASHLTLLGIDVLGDGGRLFWLAVTVFAAAAWLVWLRRNELPFVGQRFVPRRGVGPDPARRVLILGGGFGGMYTALELERALAFEPGVEVTLVNRDNFFLFTPMLHEVAASDLDLTNIVSPLRRLLRRVSFFQGDVVSLDLEGRRAVLCHGSDGHRHELSYDVLVLGLGSITNFFGLPGLEERGLTMKSLGDAIRLRNRMIACLEEADTECAAAVRAPLTTFVVAGGGFSGVETVAGIHDFLHSALPFYPNLTPADLRVVLVHPGDVILPELGERLGSYAQRKLAERGVEIRAGTRVEACQPDRVRLSDGEVLAARTLIWTAGTCPHPLLDTLPVAKERGRIAVNEFLEVPGLEGVFALGDCAAVPDRHAGGYSPPTAQHALRQARVAARNVLAALDGTSRRVPFRFRTLGQLAAIGQRTGVARVLGVNFSGFTAWWLWRTIYLSKLPRLEKKLRVMLDWTLDVVFSKDLVQFLGTPTEVAEPTAGPRPEEPVPPRGTASRDAVPVARVGG